MKNKCIFIILSILAGTQGFAYAPSRLTRLFSETFQGAVYEKFPELRLEVRLSEKPDYLGGAYPSKNKYIIEIGENTALQFGFDTTVLVLCHELGHLLAGPPYKKTTSWNAPYKPSTEAKSDYYSANQCTKKFMKLYPNLKNEIETKPFPEVSVVCLEKYKEPHDVKLCERVAMASYQFLIFVWDLVRTSGNEQPRFDKKAQQKLSLAEQSQYPSLQCRLDIYLAGNLNQPRPECY